MFKLSIQYFMTILFFSAVVMSTGCSEQISFRHDVSPIISSNCLICHDGGGGEGIEKSGFNAHDYDSIMKGTRVGPVIVPGDSVSSTLFRMINHKVDPKIQMPPHHKNAMAEGRSKPLTPKQIEIIKIWIDQGAKDN